MIGSAEEFKGKEGSFHTSNASLEAKEVKGLITILEVGLVNGAVANAVQVSH